MVKIWVPVCVALCIVLLVICYAGQLKTDLKRNEFDSLRESTSLDDEYLSFSSNGTVNTSISRDQLFTQVDRLFNGTDQDKQRAYHLLKNKRHTYINDADFMWRLAKATYFLSQIEEGMGNDQAQQSLVYQAQDFAAKALDLNNSISNIHKWYAITLGRVGDYESTSVRIQNGYKFKEHIVRAIELNPTDPSAHYLLGRWCYGVYMLSWLERQAAAALYAKPPTSTVDEALKNFMEAENLDEGKWKDNLLFIAKCYIEKRDYSTAVTWLDKANDLPTISQDERSSQKEIDDLLYKYSGYRK